MPLLGLALLQGQHRHLSQTATGGPSSPGGGLDLNVSHLSLPRAPMLLGACPS